MSAHVYEREGREGLEASVGQGARVSIYHLLSAAFSQGVAITQVIDLDVLDVVTVLLVDLDIESTTIGRSSGGGVGRARHDAGRVGLGGKKSQLRGVGELLTGVAGILHEWAGRRHAAGPSSG